MPSPRLTLRRSLSLAVLGAVTRAADRHEDLGCSILGPPSRKVRAAHALLKHRVQALPQPQALAEAAALVRWLEATPRYAALCDGTRRHLGRRILRPSVLYPAPGLTPPKVLHLREGEQGLDVPVEGDGWRAVGELFAVLAQGATRAELALFRRSQPTADVLEALTSAGLLERHDGALPSPARGVHFIGHNTALFCGERARVLVDPYFRPASVLDLPTYQPMQPRDLPGVDAVVITHSHGDHFHLGSLLQLPRTTRLFVPRVSRESLFTTDCARRLRQAGFEHVEALDWWETRTVGDVTIQALPFYGEQPTDGEGVYPGLFNEGATWRLSDGHHSAAFFADSGHDVRGDMRAVAKRVRKAGPTDVLFCGVRGFSLRPLFYGFSTLDAYLVNVPTAALTTPQQLMADGPQALELARLLGAAHLVPCADGGAPWYWREGMGPKYPGFPGDAVDGAAGHDEHPDADPYPERVVALANRRSKGPRAVLLRPGDAYRFMPSGPKVARFDGFAWPFEAVSV